MSGQLSVTVLTGTPDNDGSYALEQLIQHSGDLRLAAIIPKRMNKRSRPSGNVPLIPTTERLVKLGQGCSCCTVRGDLMAKVRRIADEQSAEHILIHTAPHADLRTLAKTFTVADDSGRVLSDVARIDSLVTVVDAKGFLDSLGRAGARSLMERLELANVVLLQGGSGIAPQDLEQVLGCIRAINASARVVQAEEEGFVLSALRAAQPFELDLAEDRAAELAGGEEGSEEAGSVVRFDYQARRPFHPARLHALLAEPWPGVLRAKGTFWVASRPEYACALDVAGGSRNMSPEGMWWATVPVEQRPNSTQFKAYLEEIWHPAFGDRLQNLNIVGIAVDEQELLGRIEACLLTEEELSAPDEWSSLPDPFQWPAVNG